MTKFPTLIDGAFLIKPKLFKDDRGFFLESWNKNSYKEVGIDFDFVQDNHSNSECNVLRGLHYQIGNNAQGKLVWVTSGMVYDVFVDLRKSSPTYGLWDSYYLDSETHYRLWIPPGCAHGFFTMTENVNFHYKCTNYHDPKSDRTLIWNDKTLKIPWPMIKNLNPIVSEKDKNGKSFSECEKYE